MHDPEDQPAIEAAARDYVDRFGSEAVEFLLNQAENADAIRDYDSARDWRRIGEAAERLLR